MKRNVRLYLILKRELLLKVVLNQAFHMLWKSFFRLLEVALFLSVLGPSENQANVLYFSI